MSGGPTGAGGLPGLTAAGAVAVRAWIAGGPFGLVLVGDSLLRERTWHALVEEAGLSTAPSAGPGTELSALYGRVDPWTGTARPGLLDRARTEVLLLPAADLLGPAHAAALARAPRLLAQAPALADVPAVLAPRLTAVLDLAHRPGDAETLRALTRPAGGSVPARATGAAGAVRAPAGHEVVELLSRYGLVGHTLDLGATRLAGALALSGAEDVLGTVEQLVCRPRSPEVPPPAEPQEPENRREPENQENGAEPVEDNGPGEDNGPDQEHGPGRDDGHGSGEDGAGEQAPDRGPLDGEGRPDDPSPEGSADAPEQGAEPPGSVPAPSGDTGRRTRRTTRTGLDGKHGAPAVHPVRGRRRRVVSVDATGGRPDVVATLTAALPWQRQRRGPGGGGVLIRPEDLRGRNRVLRGGRLLIIVVDASGSMAQDMIRRAKAIALGELDRAYRERSTVGIVLARGPHAVVGLPPTRSTNRAREALRALPTGGGTPLASALLLAARTAARYDPGQVGVIVLTDGRANVGLGGDPRADAVRTAALLSDACGTVQLDAVVRRGRGDTTAWLRQALSAGRAQLVGPAGPPAGQRVSIRTTVST